MHKGQGDYELVLMNLNLKPDYEINREPQQNRRDQDLDLVQIR